MGRFLSGRWFRCLFGLGGWCGRLRGFLFCGWGGGFGLGGPFLDQRDGSPDGHLFTLGDLKFHDLAGSGGGDFNHGLIGLEFEDGLTFLNGIANGDVKADDISAFDVVAQVGEFDFFCHVGFTYRA